MIVKGKTKPVDAATRALRILKVFNHRTPTLQLSQIAQKTGMVKSTTLRMLVTLVEEGYMTVDNEKRYSLGPELYRLGRCYVESFNLESHIRPKLKVLVEETGESISFFQQVGNKRMCLFREDSDQVLREHVAEGDTVDLDRGAAGRVLIDFEAVSGIEPASKDQRLSLPYLSLGERDAGIGGIAVPVFSSLQGLVGALTISGPVSRLSSQRMLELAPHLYSAAAELSRSMGTQFYD